MRTLEHTSLRSTQIKAHTTSPMTCSDVLSAPPLFNIRFNTILKAVALVTTVRVPMAVALAICHWQLRNDANDVGFVLGSSPKERFPTTEELDKLKTSRASRG